MMAEPIIRVWLGPMWTEIVPLIRMLCIASLSLFAACLTYPVLVAVGRVRDTLVSSLISLPPSLLVIFVASFFGAEAVAASALLTLPFQAIVALYFISRHLAMSPADLLRATLKSGIVTACSIAGVLLSMAIVEFSSAGPIVALFSAGMCAAAGWWLGLVVTNHPLLAQIRLAAGGIGAAARKLVFLAGAEAPFGRGIAVIQDRWSCRSYPFGGLGGRYVAISAGVKSGHRGVVDGYW